MPDWNWVTLLVGGGAGGVAVTLVKAFVDRKQMGAATGKTQADTVDVNISIAGRVRDAAVQDWERVTRELADLRREFDTFRVDANDELTKLHAELRDERAQKAAVKRENDELRARVQEAEGRVDELEAEVRWLKSANGH